MTLCYDGSFEGMVCALFRALDDPSRSGDIVPLDAESGDLFEECVNVETDAAAAAAFLSDLRGRFSDRVVRNLYLCYLSELPGVEKRLFDYLVLAGKMGEDVDLRESETAVLDVHRIRNKVSFEAHRLTGLVRFRKLSGNVYYAPIEPDHNVLGLLVSHFQARFRGQKWIIHDIRRGQAILSNGRSWKIGDMNLEKGGIPGDHPETGAETDEQDYRELWKTYYDCIAIRERINPRLQRRCMPVRYWKYLVEKRVR